MRKYTRKLFWEWVDITPNFKDCWEWKGCRNSKGYGIVRRHGKSVLAHRYALACYDAISMLPPNVNALHLCDNPPCCNPTHLHWGNHGKNMEEKMERNPNAGSCPGERNGQAKLTAEQVLEIRQRADSGESRTTIVAEFNISKSTVTNIKLRRAWTHLE